MLRGDLGGEGETMNETNAFEGVFEDSINGMAALCTILLALAWDGYLR